MKTRHMAALLGGLLLGGCTPDINPAEVNEMLLQPSRGLMGGVEFGDSWEKIKADHDKRYKVRDETMMLGANQDQPSTYYQLRRDLGSPGEEGFYITFRLDEQKNVKAYDVSIFGSSKNAVTVRKLLDDVIAHFDKKIGGGHCGKTPGGKGNSSNCQWGGKDKPSVDLMYMEMSDPIHGTIEINISPPGKK